MAGHVSSRNLLAYTIPAVIAILSLIWFRRRREHLTKDPPSDVSHSTHCTSPDNLSVVCSRPLEDAKNSVLEQSDIVELHNETAEIFKEELLKSSSSYIIESNINQNCSVVCENTECTTMKTCDTNNVQVETILRELLPNINVEESKTIQNENLLPSLIHSNSVKNTELETAFSNTSVDKHNTDYSLYSVTSENENYTNTSINEVQISIPVSHTDNHNKTQSVTSEFSILADEIRTDLDEKNVNIENATNGVNQNQEESAEQCLYGKNKSDFFENELPSDQLNVSTYCNTETLEMSRDFLEINDKIDLSAKSEIANLLPSETNQKLEPVPVKDESNVIEVKDSTFHTPVTVHSFSSEQTDITDSPPYGNYSDIHSEGSSDSGKGGSDIQFGSDISHSSSSDVIIYEFELPQDLCGRLIGKMGKQVKYIKERSNANIFIKRHPFSPTLKLCAIEGSSSEIRNALDLIRKKFPPSQFPAVTLSQVNVPTTCGVPIPETLQLHLPEGVTCNVILSSMISAGHFFLQQPTHPTYPSLSQLDQCMLACYSQMDAPQLPQPIETGIICAATIMNGWFRAQVINVYEDREECGIKFVDYGGYSQVPNSSLRQIRSDFMTLPFQASECYLSNVKPVDEEAGWSLEACAAFEELAQGQILQSVIVAYAEDEIPYVQLYRIQGVSTVFVNRELVNRGVALWVEHQI